MFKVAKNTRTTHQTYLKLTIKTPDQRLVLLLLQIVRPLIADEILKQYKLILKLILHTLSDISQKMYLSLFFR